MAIEEDGGEAFGVGAGGFRLPEKSGRVAGGGSIAMARLAEPRLQKLWLMPWVARLPGQAVVINSAQVGS